MRPMLDAEADASSGLSRVGAAATRSSDMPASLGAGTREIREALRAVVRSALRGQRIMRSTPAPRRPSAIR